MHRVLLRVSLAVLGSVAAIALLIGIQLQLGNFHEVIPGELYRSAQPTGADLEKYVKQHGIKSVLNLRGGNAGDAWYNDEVAATQSLGITHLDFRMKAARELTDEQVGELIVIMKHAPKPLLIHCHSGSDRTGLAAALYLEAIAKKSPAEADYQLSLRYGHLPFWWTRAQAMDRTLGRVESHNLKLVDISSSVRKVPAVTGVAPPPSPPYDEDQINAISEELFRQAKVLVGLRGDLNGDKKVDLDDVAMLQRWVNTPPRTDGYDPRDLNNDGKIDALDVQILTTLCSKPHCAR